MSLVMNDRDVLRRPCRICWSDIGLDLKKIAITTKQAKLKLL